MLHWKNHPLWFRRKMDTLLGVVSKYYKNYLTDYLWRVRNSSVFSQATSHGLNLKLLQEGAIMGPVLPQRKPIYKDQIKNGWPWTFCLCWKYTHSWTWGHRHENPATSGWGRRTSSGLVWAKKQVQGQSEQLGVLKVKGRKGCHLRQSDCLTLAKSCIRIPAQEKKKSLIGSNRLRAQ